MSSTPSCISRFNLKVLWLCCIAAVPRVRRSRQIICRFCRFCGIDLIHPCADFMIPGLPWPPPPPMPMGLGNVNEDPTEPINETKHAHVTKLLVFNFFFVCTAHFASHPTLLFSTRARTHTYTNTHTHTHARMYARTHPRLHTCSLSLSSHTRTHMHTHTHTHAHTHKFHHTKAVCLRTQPLLTRPPPHCHPCKSAVAVLFTAAFGNLPGTRSGATLGADIASC